jgi:hypothetical protein
MLNSASDYKFVDTSGIAGLIHGNILPVTHPNSYAISPTYYEDYLFLLEAYNERNQLNSAGDNDVVPAPRVYYASNFTSLVPSASNQSSPLNGNPSTPETRPYMYNSYGRWVGDSTTFPSVLEYQPDYGGGYSS